MMTRDEGAAGTGRLAVPIPPLEYHLTLIEKAVLWALRGRPEETVFRRERDPLYGIEEPEGRDAAFARLHAEWFVRLGLDRPLITALAEVSLVCSGVASCFIVGVARARDEAGELFVAPQDGGERRVRIALRPETLSSQSVLFFFRHELQHVSDMLDPDFGYEPTLPARPDGRPQQWMVDRYRVLWDAYIDGRLCRAGRSPSSVRDERRREVTTAFAALGSEAGALFCRMFDAPGPLTHREILALASRSHPVGARPSGEPCPLCGCATYSSEAASLSSDVLRLIRGDFPAWSAAAGLCSRCADLYRARLLPSPAAARLSRQRQIEQREVDEVTAARTPGT